MSIPTSVENIQESGLCTGCAVCAAICPQQCITMQETPGGLLEANVLAEQCTSCGLCQKVCGAYSCAQLPLLNVNTDPFRGECLKAFLVYATDESLRKTGQSGGVLIALAQFLLQTGQVKSVLSSVMPQDGSLRPVARWMRTSEELVASTGSKYVPLPWGEALAELQPDEAVALIGLPCQFRSFLGAAQSIKPQWAKSVKLKIGLNCDRTLSYAIMDYIFQVASIDQTQCKEFFFRSKKRSGWSGEGLAVLQSGEERFVPDSVRTKNRDAFTPYYCRLCFDKMNVNADIVGADPYGINLDPLGHTVLVARTSAGLEVIEAAIKEGVLSVVQELPYEQILVSQGMERRRGNWTAFSGIAREEGRTVPDFGISPKWYATTRITSLQKQVYRLKLERGWFLKQARTRLETLESAGEFRKALSVLTNRISFWQKWSVRGIVRRIVSRLGRIIKKFKTVVGKSPR